MDLVIDRVELSGPTLAALSALFLRDTTSKNYEPIRGLLLGTIAVSEEQISRSDADREHQAGLGSYKMIHSVVVTGFKVISPTEKISILSLTQEGIVGCFSTRQCRGNRTAEPSLRERVLFKECVDCLKSKENSVFGLFTFSFDSHERMRGLSFSYRFFNHRLQYGDGAYSMVPMKTAIRSIGQDGRYCGSFVNKLNVRAEENSLANSVDEIENNAKSLVDIL